MRSGIWLRNTILIRNPGAFNVVRFVLGHQSLQTTTDKYASMDSMAAFRLVDQLIAEKARLGQGHQRMANKQVRVKVV
jgi:hypothetical protein